MAEVYTPLQLTSGTLFTQQTLRRASGFSGTRAWTRTERHDPRKPDGNEFRIAAARRTRARAGGLTRRRSTPSNKFKVDTARTDAPQHQRRRRQPDAEVGHQRPARRRWLFRGTMLDEPDPEPFEQHLEQGPQ